MQKENFITFRKGFRAIKSSQKWPTQGQAETNYKKERNNSKQSKVDLHHPRG